MSLRDSQTKVLERKWFIYNQVKLSGWIKDIHGAGLDCPERNEEFPFLDSVLSHKIPQLPDTPVLQMYLIKPLVTLQNLTQVPTRSPASQLFPPEFKLFSHSILVIFF
jgi:hypothetical protein